MSDWKRKSHSLTDQAPQPFLEMEVLYRDRREAMISEILQEIPGVDEECVETFDHFDQSVLVEFLGKGREVGS